MNYDEFQRHIGKAGLKLHEFASLMDMSHVSVSNYRKRGEVPRHLAMVAALLGEMADRGIDFREIISRIDFVPKKEREAGAGRFGGDKAKQE
jgi:hypothetical protein